MKKTQNDNLYRGENVRFDFKINVRSIYSIIQTIQYTLHAKVFFFIIIILFLALVVRRE